MQSLKELYKIGNGPSSSHTMGPKRATELFKNKYSRVANLCFYGSFKCSNDWMKIQVHDDKGN